jgi:phytol kinase
MKLFYFFYDNLPAFSLLAWLFPVSLFYAVATLYFAGFLKQRFGWRTGLTRKTFHFLIFIFVFIVQLNFSLPGTFIVGWAVTAVLILAIRKGNGHLLYEALAREQDAPHRSRYIVYSYLATFGGGVLSNLLFGKFYAIFGYLITGIADALAEPVGLLYGKHKYRVLNFNKKWAYRSLEGSVAVFVSTFFVLWVCCHLMPGLWHVSASRLLLCSAVCTLTEAVAPQGWDNLLLQVISGFAVFNWLN